jgi:hypothetical protein
VSTKRSAPTGTKWTMKIKDDWTPTAANINALPEPLRIYIHDLNTVCDPAGDVRELFRLQVENRMLRWECERLAQRAGVGPKRRKIVQAKSPAVASLDEDRFAEAAQRPKRP